MRSEHGRSLARLTRVGALVAGLAACGGAEQGAGAKGGASERLICPSCERHAGGESSDFGDGTTHLPLTGSGVWPAATPCEQSEQVSNIDVATARELGFGDALDQLDRSFEVPFSWTALELTQGSAAAGYSPETRLEGTLAIASIRHRAPSLSGCEDLLEVRLAMTLAAADGAFSISGHVNARSVHRGDLMTEAYGALDLSQVQGSLEIHPPDYDALAAFIVPFIYLWPEETRLSMQVVALDPADFDSDSPGYQYIPLEGRGPVDACIPPMLPLDLAEPMPFADGVSFAQSFPELASAFTARSRPAAWRSGGETTVTHELGGPFDLCVGDNEVVKYSVPYRVVSADARVSIEATARAFARYGEGVLMNAWVEIFRQEVELRDTFASRTGISGIEFGQHGGAVWHTELYLDDQTDDAVHNPALRGEITVEGVDTDGSITGFENAYTESVLDQLTW